MTCNPGQVVVQFTKATGGVNDSFTDYRYQAVLVNDLSVSLQVAYQSGKGAGEGSIISAETTDPTRITLPAGKPVSGYLAVSTSGIRTNTQSKDRIQSGWKLYTSADGMPLRITVGTDTSLYAMAQYTGTDKSSAVAMITFAMSNASNMSLTLNKGTSPVINIANLGTVSSSGNILVTDDIKNAIISISSSITNVIVKKDSSGYTFFTIFALVTNPSMAEEITYNVTSVPLSKVWAEGKIAVSPDAGLENILSTTGLLTRLASASTDPVTETPGGSTSDSLSVKLLSSILFHRVIAHNSPVSDLLEEDNGIFTNYIQYFDDIVKNWDSVNDSAAGLPRLRGIYNRICNLNKTVIIDPFSLECNGTAIENNSIEKKRKNYVFYDMFVKMDIKFQDTVDTNQKTGAGVFVNVSPNIGVYCANADSGAVFDSSFLGNDAASKCMMLSSSDSLLRKVQKYGMWITGINDTKADGPYAFGMKTIRLPMYGTSVYNLRQEYDWDNAIDNYFNIHGSIVGGAGKSIFKVIPLVPKDCDTNTIDTLENTTNNNVMLHYQKRLVEIDTSYIDGNVQTGFYIAYPDSSKIYIERRDAFRAILADSSQTIQSFFMTLFSGAGADRTAVAIKKDNLVVAKLFTFDAQNGVLNFNALTGYPSPVQLATFANIAPFDIFSAGANVKIRWSDHLKVYEDEARSRLLIPNKTRWGAKQTDKTLLLSWQEYKDNFVNKGTFYFESNKTGVQTLDVIMCINGNCTPENIKESVSYNVNFSNIVFEPICNDIVPGTALEVYNPCCVVKNEFAHFKIEADLSVSDDDIIWKSKNSKIRFVNGAGVESDEGHGRIVKVIGKSTGDEKITIGITGYNGPAPETDISVVDWKNVNLFTQLVKNNDSVSAWTILEVEQKIDSVNGILKQIGVRITRQNMPLETMNGNEYYDITTGEAADILIKSNKNTGGMEAYFINTETFEKYIAQNYINRGIIIVREANARSIAHEIMHSARNNRDMPNIAHVRDIYEEKQIYSIDPDLKIMQSNIPLDWGTGYYNVNLKHRNFVITRPLQYGKYSSEKADIPLGNVYGVTRNVSGDYLFDMVHCGFKNVSERVFKHEY